MPRGSPNRRLLPLENFVDCGLAAFVDANDSVDRLETGHRDIHDVVPRSEHDVDWRDLIKDPLVDCNLRAFRQGANGDGTHASRALSAASKQLVELADGAYVLSIAQSPEYGRELEILRGTEIGTGGFVEIPVLAYQNGVASFFHCELRRRHSSGGLAVDDDLGARRRAVHHHQRID